MALRKPNLPREITLFPRVKSAPNNILCSCVFHAGAVDRRLVFLPRVAARHGKRDPPAALLRWGGFSFPGRSPRMALAPFFIPFPLPHTLGLLTNPQWTRGDLLGFTRHR